MKFENLDVIFKGDIVKKGETYLLVTETRSLNFSGIDLSDGEEKPYTYGDIEVIAIGERGFKEQNKRYREAIKKALEEEEQNLEGYESSVYKILSEALEGR